MCGVLYIVIIYHMNITYYKCMAYFCLGPLHTGGYPSTSQKRSFLLLKLFLARTPLKGHGRSMESCVYTIVLEWPSVTKGC